MVLVLNFWLFVDLEWFPPWVSSGLVIFLSAVANLASVGCKITIEKDWIVVVSEDNEEKLATMNAVFRYNIDFLVYILVVKDFLDKILLIFCCRTIDLTCLIVAPMIAGFIFDFASTEAAAIAIASWNIVSGMVSNSFFLTYSTKFLPLTLTCQPNPVYGVLRG